ncbi:peptide chain release factor 1 [Candidatus Dependentiae bacterium]|nr:peptide chain release factor 1 [Candidatus Dependentiae bacterium]
MLDWILLQKEYDELIAKLVDPALEQRQRATFQKQASQYGHVLEAHKQIVAAQNEFDSNKKQIEQESGEMRQLYEEENQQLELKIKKLNRELEDLLYPADDRDERSVFIEIRAGAGGQEAALFAADLYRMYQNYALSKNWEVSVVDCSTTDLGGFKELIMHIKGKRGFKHFKFESGVHRVQRVPKTETAGRVHTSTVTVAVMPEVDDVDVQINPSDLRIDTYRSSGAGGQHVNTTDSAIRITHIPTGVVVTCQDERSQTKNKAKAMKVLQARIYEAERAKHEAQESAARKQQVGTGERSEKIRTYNFPQNRVSDHRTEVTLKKLDLVMEGDLEDLIEPLFEWDIQQRRSRGSLFIGQTGSK